MIKKLGCSKLEQYKALIKKYRLIFRTLEYFKEYQSLLIGSFWASVYDLDEIVRSVDALKEKDPSFVSAHIYPMSHDKQPPTLFRTNDFTQPYLTIVETYSVPKYKEINPAMVSTVTFPFLFGLMFADVAHGLAFLMIGIWIARSDLGQSRKTLAIFKLRYMIIAMGFFAVYCGFIYNDFMGSKMYNAKSCYVEVEGYVNTKQADGTITRSTEAVNRRLPDCVYPFGIDHVWGFARNEITFENSFKMKLSIIVGVIQMCLGIVFRGNPT